MGLFSFFRDRRARESATQGADVSVDSAVSAESGSITSLGALGDLGVTISQLQKFKEGSGQIEGADQVFDLRGGDARGEVMEVLKQHGMMSLDGSTAAPADPAAMQRDIFAALERAGLDLSAMGVPMPQMDQAPTQEPEELDIEALRRDPDSGIRNPLDR